MGGPRTGVSVEWLGDFFFFTMEKKLFPEDLAFFHCIIEHGLELLVTIKS